MIAIHPWLRGLAVGMLAFLLVLHLDFPTACLGAIVASLVAGDQFSKDQKAFERKLLFRKRLYNCDIERAFARINWALANAWLQESHWQCRVSELTKGVMLYRYEWREPKSIIDEGLRRHANLQVECVDGSDLEGDKTVATFAFDGFPNLVDKHTFYDAVHLAMGAIDAYLPEHKVIEPEFDSEEKDSTFVDRDKAAAKDAACRFEKG